MDAPRVTRDQIDRLFEKLEYVYHVPESTTVTFCSVFLPGKEGRKFLIATGMSACVSPANFNKEVGENQSKQNASHQAYDKLWELEGYALFKELENAGQ
jgi:hypothetical protein